MKEGAVQDFILRTLKQIAPEADFVGLSPDKRFRDQFQFDSMDFLNFALALQDELKIRIPEEDFPSLATLNGCIDYLLSKDAAITAPKKP